MTTQQLRTEALRIAAANGAEILDHDDDWTFFTLNDGDKVGPEGTDGNGFLAGRSMRTHFEWVEERFEGFVS